jgi:hypothetical protein
VVIISTLFGNALTHVVFPFSASKREKLSKFVRSPSVEEVDDDDGASAPSGFVVSETIGHYVDAEGNQVRF